MSRSWRKTARALSLAALGLAPAGPASAQDRPQPPIEVYEWSVWVGNPAQPSLNGVKAARNAMPAAVGTIRPVLEGEELARRFAVAPISVVQVVGDPVDDIDVELKVKKGSIVAHWPQATERSNGLRWFRSNLLAKPPGGISPGYIAEDHWFQKLRQNPPALFLQRENRVERFLAYDCEVAAPLPVKVRGGPDEFTLQNLTEHNLVDVAVVLPVEGGGIRIGWLDTLPAAAPKDPAAEARKKEEAEAKEKASKQPDAQAKAATAVFEGAEADAKAAAEKKDKPKPEDEPKPLPPEADADLKARVDQALNRPVNVNVEKASRSEVLALVASQARVRYDVDEPTLRKASVDLAQPMTLKSPSIAARDALAEILGPAGLSYRVGDDGGLFITTAARLAESGKKVVIEGPPVKLTLGPPLPPGDKAFAEKTRDAYAKRLVAQGMRADVAQVYLDQYAPSLFQPRDMVVLAHLAREAIDEAVVLDVFPTPRKLVRTAVVVAHGVDPRLADQARVLVRKLGDPASRARDQAEKQLFEMGPVAVPVLEDALRDKDLEVVFRAERVLLRLNRPVP